MSDSADLLRALKLRKYIDRNSGEVASRACHDLYANLHFSGLAGFHIMGSTNLVGRRSPDHMESEVAVSYVEESVIYFAQIWAHCIRSVRSSMYPLLLNLTFECSILFAQVLDSFQLSLSTCRIYFYLRSVSLSLSVLGVQLILVLQGLFVIHL
jgi:hypothetical protein